MSWMRLETLAAVLCGGLLTPAPAVAQMDLSGGWATRLHEDWGDRFFGPDAVDFLGLPLNDDGRAKALSYSSSQIAVPERRCVQYPPDYVVLGPQSLQISSETEPITGRVLAWHISGAGDRTPLTIWMDGRPHPSPHALHTFGGFSTGVWDGDGLTVYTTHIKAGVLRRNGVLSSDRTTMTEHFWRHGDLLTIMAVIDDPVYLSEPFVVSRSWQLDPKQQLNWYYGPCWPGVEIPRLGVTGVVPHYLPGRNPFVDEVRTRYNLPADAVMGGAHTMYPEYGKKLRETYVPPTICVRYCCGWVMASGRGNDAPGLNCSDFHN